MTDKDPILEEIYEARRALSRAAGGDLAKIFELLRLEEAAGRKRTVPRKPRRIAPGPPAESVK